MSKPTEDALVLPHDTCNVAIVCLPRQSFLLLPKKNLNYMSFCWRFETTTMFTCLRPFCIHIIIWVHISYRSIDHYCVWRCKQSVNTISWADSYLKPENVLTKCWHERKLLCLHSLLHKTWLMNTWPHPCWVKLQLITVQTRMLTTMEGYAIGEALNVLIHNYHRVSFLPHRPRQYSVV